MSLQYRPQGVFHIVTQGECYLREGSRQTPIHLRAGDVIAFPTGGAHWLSDSLESQELEAENVIPLGEQREALLFKSGEVSAFSTGMAHKNVLTQDAGEQATVLLSGVFSYETAINHPFLKDLPCFIKLDHSVERDSDWVAMLVNALESESKTPTAGSTLVIDRLAEILFIKLLRTYIQTLEQPSGYIAALADPKIGVALNLIHSETDEGWSIESLSKAVALSRTSFTKKFNDLVGINPKPYLTKTRMLNAKVRLESSTESMRSIAEKAGYSSEAAFSKAIRKYFGQTPGQLRKRARKAP